MESTWLKVSQNFPVVKGANAKLGTGLRYMSQLYRMNKNESLIQQTRDAVEMVYTYQGSASGTITADEYIGGNSPQRG